MTTRRGFLGLLGGASLAPILPAMPGGAAAATRGLHVSLYARAVGHARTRAQVSAKGLSYCLKISSEQAEALMARLTSKGVITPIAGTARAATSSFSHTGTISKPYRNHTPNSNLPSLTPPSESVNDSQGNDMKKFTKLTGTAAPMPLVNIDTDMIIPKVFLKTIKRSGLGVNLFDEMRYDREGNELPDFVLNKPQYRDAQILVAGDNFGCGSSREHAPWALLDFGIRCVISTSFADIFYNNCFKNGILPIVVSPEDHAKLMDDAERGSNATLTVDLEEQTISGPDGGEVAFEVDAFKKHCLLNGLDDIGLTLEKASAIDRFEAQHAAARPWV